MMYHYGYLGPFSSMGTILGWVLFGLLVMWIVRVARGDRHEYWMHKMHKHGIGMDNAMNILREKYAKGEISKEEFESKKKDLTS